MLLFTMSLKQIWQQSHLLQYVFNQIINLFDTFHLNVIVSFI